MSAATWRCSGADDSAAPGLHSQRHMLRSSASACLRGATRGAWHAGLERDAQYAGACTAFARIAAGAASGAFSRIGEQAPRRRQEPGNFHI